MLLLVCSEAVESKSRKTGGQPYSNASPNGDCSLTLRYHFIKESSLLDRVLLPGRSLLTCTTILNFYLF